MKTSIKLVSTAVLALIVFGAASSVASAEDVTYNSKGSVTFKPNTDSTLPVDPITGGGKDGSDTVTPENPDGSKPNPGTAGPLSLDFASSFDFGTQKITSADQTYYAVEQKYADKAGTAKTGPNYVQVTDNRGTLAGWSLSVTQDAQFAAATTTKGAGSVLDGTVMTLGNGKIISQSANPADSSAVSTVLTPGVKSSVILGAKTGKGSGTNLLTFGDENTAVSSVSLMVPGATTKLAQQYSTNLTWTLSDTPAV